MLLIIKDRFLAERHSGGKLHFGTGADVLDYRSAANVIYGNGSQGVANLGCVPLLASSHKQAASSQYHCDIRSCRPALS